MASKYTYPEKYLRWFLEDNKIALVTTDVVDASVVVDDIFNAIDESLVDGLLVYYEGSVPKLDISAKNIQTYEPDIPKRVQSALIHYILSNLYADKLDMNEADIVSANRHYTAWKKRIAITNGGKLQYDGPKIPIPDKRTALR